MLSETKPLPRSCRLHSADTGRNVRSADPCRRENLEAAAGKDLARRCLQVNCGVEPRQGAPHPSTSAARSCDPQSLFPLTLRVLANLYQRRPNPDTLDSSSATHPLTLAEAKGAELQAAAGLHSFGGICLTILYKTGM